VTAPAAGRSEKEMIVDANTRKQIEGLEKMGLTVIGSFVRKGGGTVVLIVCGACGLARSPDHRCPHCELKALEDRFARMCAAFDQIQAGLSAARLLAVR
jgi:hypothetical protein